MTRVIAVAAFTVGFPSARAQTGPASGFYQITSGTFIKCCGIAGEVRSALPNDDQAFLRLTVDPQTQLATLAFIGKDMSTVYSVVSCPSNESIYFKFDYGFSVLNSLVFHVDPGPPPLNENWSYTVTNTGPALKIDGQLSINPAGCADAYTRFTHTTVVAVLMPRAAIRVSEVEVCWNSVSNRLYQVQYRSALSADQWTNLGASVAGSGTTNCVADKVLAGEAQRAYRVLMMP